MANLLFLKNKFKAYSFNSMCNLNKSRMIKVRKITFLNYFNIYDTNYSFNNVYLQ